MRQVVIHSPIWKTRSIGIAERKITEDLEVTIDYKKRDGSRLYPNPFRLTKSKALTFPVQVVKGVRLRIIPIHELREIPPSPMGSAEEVQAVQAN